jgi:predicted lipid-binding transport protein (Tim44 family)
MTFGKGSALALGLVCGVALGVWAGPYVTPMFHEKLPAEPAAASPAVATAPSHSDMKPASRVRTTATAAPAPAAPAIPVTAPALEMRLKPLLNRGTNMTGAASGFTSAEQFAAVAHAAYNTKVPFQVLKDRVVGQGLSLASAIHEVNPTLNATSEADRARAEAEADLGKISG